MNEALRRDAGTIQRTRTVVGDAALIVGGSALIALAARVAVPLPFSPVPVTGQTFAVLVTAAILGARRAPLAVLLYVAEAIAGMPVLAGGGAGLATVLGPTGGYIAGFAAAALVIGLASDRGATRRITTTLAALLAGEILIYAFGLAWLSRYPLSVPLLDAGLLPFVAGDLYKMSLAVVVLRGMSSLRARLG